VLLVFAEYTMRLKSLTKKTITWYHNWTYADLVGHSQSTEPSELHSLQQASCHSSWSHSYGTCPAVLDPPLFHQDHTFIMRSTDWIKITVFWDVMPWRVIEQVLQ
jgi:hypothetical protein